METKEGEVLQQQKEENGQDLGVIYRSALIGWSDLLKASERIQYACNELKKTDQSISGFQIEKALNKHKVHLIAAHMANLEEFMRTKGIEFPSAETK